eukprot:scaffold20399_cov21-Tisochrysis_lutea.AAC.1
MLGLHAPWLTSAAPGILDMPRKSSTLPNTSAPAGDSNSSNSFLVTGPCTSSTTWQAASRHDRSCRANGGSAGHAYISLVTGPCTSSTTWQAASKQGRSCKARGSVAGHAVWQVGASRLSNRVERVMQWPGSRGALAANVPPWAVGCDTMARVQVVGCAPQCKAIQAKNASHLCEEHQ